MAAAAALASSSAAAATFGRGANRPASSVRRDVASIRSTTSSSSSSSSRRGPGAGPVPVVRAAAKSSSALDELLGAKIIAPNGGGDAEVRDSVTKYYGETLQTSDDLKTSACCTPNLLPKKIKSILASVPDEVKAKYYGCGSPTPLGIDGLRVLDLGSGSGRDCYVAAALVGESGSVIGIDMTDAQVRAVASLAFFTHPVGSTFDRVPFQLTDAFFFTQLDVARRHAETYCVDALGYAAPGNMEFRKGTIEDLRAANVEDNSVDLIISNCVINLSPDKPAVLSEAMRALADGGEFYFSDVYCDRRLPEDLRSHEILLGECLGGAMYVEDFKRLCVATGFADPRVLEGHEIEIKDEVRFMSHWFPYDRVGAVNAVP
jgi:arsenite methyltransferase